MKRPDLATLLILVTGNALLWSSLLAEPAPTEFDFTHFAAAVRAAWGCDDLARRVFDDESLLPEQYLYLESEGRAQSLRSVYAGYYPSQTLLGAQPHEPRACYRSAGWELVGEPRVVRVSPDSGPTLFASRILVQRHGEVRLVLYWLQQGGSLPTTPSGRPTWLEELGNRVFAQRSDQVWVRLELDPATVTFPLAPEVGQRLRATMLAAHRAMEVDRLR